MASLADLGELARRGQEIYKREYRERFECEHMGEYAVIEVESGRAYLGESAMDAIDAARREFAQGLFHLVKVGQPGAFRVSYTSDAAARGL
jgi:hypothetical protein